MRVCARYGCRNDANGDKRHCVKCLAERSAEYQKVVDVCFEAGANLVNESPAEFLSKTLRQLRATDRIIAERLDPDAIERQVAKAKSSVADMLIGMTMTFQPGGLVGNETGDVGAEEAANRVRLALAARSIVNGCAMLDEDYIQDCAVSDLVPFVQATAKEFFDRGRAGR